MHAFEMLHEFNSSINMNYVSLCNTLTALLNTLNERGSKCMHIDNLFKLNFQCIFVIINNIC